MPSIESPQTILHDGIIDGRMAARQLRAEVSLHVAELAEHGIVPHCAFVRLGNDPASETYVGAKERAAARVGIKSTHIHLPDTTTGDELAAIVARLNADPEVDGILVQLPLPEATGSPEALNQIDPDKDVDGFHPRNLGAMLAGDGPLRPCTPAGILHMIDDIGINLVGLNAVVVGRSVMVGRPMAALLLRGHATTTICHRHTTDLVQHTSQADVLVVATGVPGLITAEHVKPGAYVFDVGITRMPNGKLAGDVRFDEVHGRAAGITPVPGGVGPMTIAQLLKNTVIAARLHRGLQPSTIHRA